MFLGQFFLSVLRRRQARMRFEGLIERSLIVEARLVGDRDHVAFLVAGVGQQAFGLFYAVLIDKVGKTFAQFLHEYYSNTHKSLETR